MSVAKAEGVSDSGGAFVKTYLGGGEGLEGGEELYTATSDGEKSENMWEKLLCIHQGQWRSRDFPAAFHEDHGEAVLLQPMDVNIGANTYLRHMKDSMPELMGVPQRGCYCVGSLG